MKCIVLSPPDIHMQTDNVIFSERGKDEKSAVQVYLTWAESCNGLTQALTAERDSPDVKRMNTWKTCASLA